MNGIRKALLLFPRESLCLLLFIIHHSAFCLKSEEPPPSPAEVTHIPLFQGGNLLRPLSRNDRRDSLEIKTGYRFFFVAERGSRFFISDQLASRSIYALIVILPRRPRKRKIHLCVGRLSSVGALLCRRVADPAYSGAHSFPFLMETPIVQCVQTWRHMTVVLLILRFRLTGETRCRERS